MTSASNSDEWRRHIVEDREGITRVLDATRRVAVLGIKVEPDRPAHFVPAYVQEAGIEIVPVPVYYPD